MLRDLFGGLALLLFGTEQMADGFLVLVSLQADEKFGSRQAGRIKERYVRTSPSGSVLQLRFLPRPVVTGARQVSRSSAANTE